MCGVAELPAPGTGTGSSDSHSWGWTGHGGEWTGPAQLVLPQLWAYSGFNTGETLRAPFQLNCAKLQEQRTEDFSHLPPDGSEESSQS